MLWLGVVVALVEPSRAGAQALYYRSIPVGERAIGLGGAFTGVASDPSAAYFNPAGMTTGGRFDLLGSFSSLVFTRKRFDSAFDTPGSDGSFTTKGTTTLPRFIGTVVRFGRAKNGTDHQFALGYSTLEVARDALGDGITEATEALSLDVRVFSDYVSRWYGLSFAAQVTRKSSVGFTVYLADQGVGYNEDIGLATGGEFNPLTQVRLGGESATTSGTASVSAYHFVPRLGWLHQINPRWRVGVMFQTPGIPLKQRGNNVRRLTGVSDSADSVFFVAEQSDLEANLPIPFELDAGFGFQINETTLLSVDVAVSGPIGDKLVITPPDELQEIDGEVGVYFANSTKRRAVPNAAIGAEHKFGKVTVAGGFFTNISAAPNVPATATEYTPDQVSMYGASFAVGLDTNGYRFTAGATGMFGVGDALGVQIDQEGNAASYSRTKATRSIVLLYIAGAISVASKGAREVQERYQERKGRKEEGDEEGSSSGDPDPEIDVSSTRPNGSKGDLASGEDDSPIELDVQDDGGL